MEKIKTHLDNLTKDPTTNINLVLQTRPSLTELSQMTEEQITSLYRSAIVSYHSKEHADRTELDWLGTLVQKYAQSPSVNKTLCNNFSIFLLNSWAHYFLYQDNIPSAEEALTNTKRYHGSEDIDADLITLSICFNNLAIINLSKSQYQQAYNTAHILLVKQERHIQLCQKEGSACTGRDVVILINTYLICCKALIALKMQTSKASKVFKNYQEQLNAMHVRGSSLSRKYLGTSSLFSVSFTKIKKTHGFSDIPVIHIFGPPEDFNSKTVLAAENVAKSIQARIINIQKIIIDDCFPEQPIRQYSGVSHIIGSMSSPVQLQNKEYLMVKPQIKEVHSFLDDEPQTPVNRIKYTVPSYQRATSILKSIEPESSQLLQTIRYPPSVIFQDPKVVQSMQGTNSQVMAQVFTREIKGVDSLTLKYYQDNQVQIVTTTVGQMGTSTFLTAQQISKASKICLSVPFPIDFDTASKQQVLLYYILPYCCIQEARIALQPMPRTIIPPFQGTFQGKDYAVHVCHVYLNEFRVVLSSSGIECPFTYELIVEEEQAIGMIEDYLTYIQTDPRIKDLQDLFKGLNTSAETAGESTPREVKYPKFKDQQVLLEEVKHSLKTLEEFVRDYELKDIHDILFIYNLHVFGERSSLVSAQETPGKYTLNLQNHLRLPTRTVKLKSTIDYSLDKMYRQLGKLLRPPTNGERLYMKKVICSRFKLRTIRKDFVEEDYRIYSGRPVDSGVNFANIAGKRLHVYDPQQGGYNTRVVTMSEVCNSDNEPLGIKVSTYDVELTCKTVVFLMLSRQIWTKHRKINKNPKSRFDEADRKRLQKRLFLNQFPATTNYNVSHIMMRGGYKKIIQTLSIKINDISLQSTPNNRVECILLDKFI